MRFIFSIIAVFAFGLGILTACQDTATPVNVTETAKTTNTNSTTVNSAPNATSKVDEHGHADEATRISLSDAKKEFDAGNVVFLDTRTEAAYNTEHIKGALNVTETNLEEKYKEIPKGKKVIAYCS